MAIQRDRNKLKALVHYVCWTVEPEVLGAIKLNKVLWVSDLWSYVHRGTPITGEHYIKRQFGPVSPSIPGLVRELETAKVLVTRRREVFEGEKVDYFALTEPDVSCFTADEMSIIDRAIYFVCYKHTAKGISDRTHDVIWELAEIGEEIPYAAMLASVLGEVTPSDVEWAKELAA